MTTGPLTGWDALATTCTEAAAALPDTQVRLMAERAAVVADPNSVSSIQDRPPTQNFRSHAARVVTAWRATSLLVGGPTVAGMLLAAATATRRARMEETVDLVWTGPGTDAIHGQATSDVVVDLINDARRTLVLSTFASRRVAKVREALAAADTRGVQITLILENENTNGQYQQAARDPFEGIHAEVLEWPANQRGPEGNWTPALHAKFVLVDDRALLITSANLTGFALDRNIEAGALIRGGPLPGRLLTHLRALVYSNVLAPVEGT